MPEKKEWKYLVHDPRRSYSQLSIKGRTCFARSVAVPFLWDGEDHETIEQIAAYRQLPIEAVKEAIEYTLSNPPEFQADWEMEERTIKKYEAIERERQERRRKQAVAPRMEQHAK